MEYKHTYIDKAECCDMPDTCCRELGICRLKAFVDGPHSLELVEKNCSFVVLAPARVPRIVKAGNE